MVLLVLLNKEPARTLRTHWWSL